MTSKTVEKLVNMLTDIDPQFPKGNWKIRRVYAGSVQRSNGAFSFFLEWAGDRKNEKAMLYSNSIGSQFPATYLIKNGIESFSNRHGDIHINPKGYGL